MSVHRQEQYITHGLGNVEKKLEPFAQANNFFLCFGTDIQPLFEHLRGGGLCQ